MTVETPTPTAEKASAAPTSKAMISSEDGVAITRDMPSVLDNYMPATYWNTFCDELDEALKPVADAKKILGWLDMIGLVLCLADIVFLVLAFVQVNSFVWWILLAVTSVIELAVALYGQSKVKTTAQAISKELKEVCSRTTKQYPQVVLNVIGDKEVLRRTEFNFNCDIYLAKNLFNDVDYIEVSIQAVEP